MSAAKAQRVRGSTFVTGFGPFLGFQSNPSEVLARDSRRDHLVLPVSYSSAGNFLESFDSAAFERLLLIGLHAGAVRPRMELLAHNWAGRTPDVDGEVWARPISEGPEVLMGRLWQGIEVAGVDRSYHPGSYLCNFIYYRALERFPALRIGFLHIPPAEAMPLAYQAELLRALLEQVEA